MAIEHMRPPKKMERKTTAGLKVKKQKTGRDQDVDENKVDEEESPLLAPDQENGNFSSNNEYEALCLEATKRVKDNKIKQNILKVKLFDRVNPDSLIDDYTESGTASFTRAGNHHRKSSVDPHALPTTLIRRQAAQGGSTGGVGLRPQLWETSQERRLMNY